MSKVKVQTAARVEPISINAVHMALKGNKCVPLQIKQLRKYYETMLRKNVELEMIDLMKSRIHAPVFVKHYFRLLLIDLED